MCPSPMQDLRLRGMDEHAYELNAIGHLNGLTKLELCACNVFVGSEEVEMGLQYELFEAELHHRQAMAQMWSRLAGAAAAPLYA